MNVPGVLRNAALIAMAGLCATAASAQTAATDPTAATLTPQQIDAQWIAATASFAPERARLLGSVDTTIAAGPYRADWVSLTHQPVPDWYRDAKFGIFIHWGVFSVPAFGSEWYSRNMYQSSEKEYAHHIKTYAPQAQSGYKDFIPQFRMEHFDPAAWATLFRKAGARYVVPVAEHHDGFPLYNSGLTEWSAAKMGPRRDVFGDLATAVRAQGMKLGASSHRAEHDWFFDGGRHFASDVNDPKYASFYGPAQLRALQGTDDSVLTKDFTFVSKTYREDWLARTTEIVEKYHPDMLYFDWWVGSPEFRETEQKFAAFYYDYAAQHNAAVVMNYKLDNMLEGAGVLDVERGELPGIREKPWQTDTSLSNASWGYIDGDTYKEPTSLVQELVDVVSKNGNLLLNIGPKADGTIPEAAQKTLLAMGGWLDVNGEAIYGSRPWKKFGEGPTGITPGSFADMHETVYKAEDFRFTTGGSLKDKGVLYAIEMAWPASGEAVIHSLPAAESRVADVALLGYTGRLVWRQAADGLHVTVPTKPVGQYAYTFRIRLEP